ncbi:hypothetical protein [Micromonospora sp. NPDC047740]|uniref:hypothetical protein n=1 Tax=Micromonospora sp. NPDC047740 TaxID=3364254 RepID=UPI003710C679
MRRQQAERGRRGPLAGRIDWTAGTLLVSHSVKRIKERNQQLAGAHEAVRQDTFPRIPDLMTAAPVPRGWAANTVPPVDSYLELASCQGWPGNALRSHQRSR